MDIKEFIIAIALIAVTMTVFKTLFNIKDDGSSQGSFNNRFLLTTVVMFLSLMTMQYFFSPTIKKTSLQSGDIIKIESVDEYQQPLKNNFSSTAFLKNDEKKYEEFSCDMAHGTVVFSEKGGTVSHYIYHKNVSEKPFDIVFSCPEKSVQKNSAYMPFLLECNVVIPEYYERDKQQEEILASQLTQSQSCVVYKIKTNDVEITKKYIIDRNSDLIDLSLVIKPTNQKITSTMFIPALRKDENSSAYAFSVDSSGKEIGVSDVSEYQDKVCVKPAFVGAITTYFANAFLPVTQGMIHRAYFVEDPFKGAGVIIDLMPIVDEVEWNARLYVGSTDTAILRNNDMRLAAAINSSIFSFLTVWVHKLLNFFYNFTHNYGLSIMLISLLILLLFLPISYLSRNGTARREEFMKKYKYVQERYKDDPERRALEQAELMKKYGALPGGLGCLPVFLQLPILFVFQTLLRTSITFYKEPFYLWISDLSQPDPYYILPAIFAYAMYLQLSRTMEAKQKFALIIGMVFIFGMFAKLSAGLALFAAMNLVLGLAQVSILKIQ